MSIHRIYLFKRFERFWHWSQALLIITLMLTGFRIHGLFGGVKFVVAIQVHIYAAWALVALWIFAIFWHFTTGEWRQYIPTAEKLFAMARYYAWGMFCGEPRPYHVASQRKHNPLQRLAYLWVKLMINPLIWVSGAALLMLAYNWTTPQSWRVWGFTLHTVAWVHTAGAYMMLCFFVVHVYLTTTGATPLAHIKAMITGWEAAEE